MKIGEKPFSECSAEEIYEIVALLRNQREALRADAIRKIAEGRAPKIRQMRQPKQTHDNKKLRNILDDVFREEFGK